MMNKERDDDVPSPSPENSPMTLNNYNNTNTTLSELNNKTKDDVNDFVMNLRKVDNNDKITACPPSTIGGRPGLALGGGLKIGGSGGKLTKL